MGISRRRFIRNSSITLGGILLHGSLILDENKINSENFRYLNEKIGIYNERGGTIGWYVNDETTIVIDSQFPETAQNFHNQLKSVSSQKIDYLFNTHHHNDHTMGNYYLKDFTDSIVANNNCIRLQEKHNKGKKTESQVVKANLTFNSEISFSLPKEKIVAMHFGKAHTGGDIVIQFENLNVVHVGDLVFNNVYPYIDNAAECTVEGWIEVLDKIVNYFEQDTKYIFGHAESTDSVIGTESDLIKMRDYLENLHNYVKKLVAKGKSKEEIVNTDSIPGSNNLIELWDGARKMNLGAMAEQIIK